MDFILPCRHIISLHEKKNIELQAESFLGHSRNECLEVRA
jgi:hypothetical protein